MRSVTCSSLRPVLAVLGALLWLAAAPFACKQGHLVPRDASLDTPAVLPDSSDPDLGAQDVAQDGVIVVDGGDAAVEPQCPGGQHSCAGTCVQDDDVRTCGQSCSPCDRVSDGTATCDGVRCGAMCPPGKMLCLGACIDTTATCIGTCQPGTHDCRGQCASNQSVNACGASCDPCPVPFGATQATCDGARCDFQCSNGYHRCGDRCLRDDDATACGSSCQACPGDPAGAGAAQCVGGTCSLKCNNGFHPCNGRCLGDTSPNSCGTSCDACPTPVGGTATCNAGQCGGSCPSTQKLCGGTCIDANAPCAGQCSPGTHDCGGVCSPNTSVNSCGLTSCQTCSRPTGALDVSCNGTSCDFTCGAGYHRCANTCIADDNAAGCGTACLVCPTDPNGTPLCQGGSCGLRCNMGYHPCQGHCVINTDRATCGPISCDPCQAPMGGSVTCDGLACVPACTATTKLCNGACIDNALACNGMCPTGTHACTGVCLPDTSPASCGGRCSPCADPPSHGVANCMTGMCGVSCEATYKNCPTTNLCVPTTGCCASSECTSGGVGTVGTCTAANTCSYVCNSATHKMCGTGCIPLAGCCSNVDCAGTGSPICNLTSHVCEKRPNGANCTTQGECVSGTCLTCYPDGDGDLFGNKFAVQTGLFCGACPAGSAPNNLDCKDSDATVNPNADFHTAMYVPDPADPTPDGWDWNCNDIADRQNMGVVLVPDGCAPGAACPTCTSNPSHNVVANQNCGEYTMGAACAAACAPMAPGCLQPSVQTYRQQCR